jgi:hypothetical protein
MRSGDLLMIGTSSLLLVQLTCLSAAAQTLHTPATKSSSKATEQSRKDWSAAIARVPLPKVGRRHCTLSAACRSF